MGQQPEGRVKSKQIFCFISFCFVLRMGAVRASFRVDRNDSVVRENLMMTGVGQHFVESYP